MSVTPNRTILIAEDEPFLNRSLCEVFTLAGFQAIAATDGEQALNLALSQKPDVIILDILMPKLDGVAVLQRLRQDIWGKSALIIILTNLTADTNLLQALAANPPSYFFYKNDMNPEQAVNKVSEILAQSEQLKAGLI